MPVMTIAMGKIHIALAIRYRYGMDRVSIRYGYGIDTCCIDTPVTVIYTKDLHGVKIWE